MYPDHQFKKTIDVVDDTKFGPSLAWIDTSSRFAFEKIAKAQGVSKAYIPPSFETFIDSIRGKLPAGKVAFYNRALGSFESYGVNRNGDCWERHWLQKKHATFVSDAEYYRDHQNKRGIHPAFGRPIQSIFNDRTDMVDLIILGDLDKTAEEDIQTLESGGRIFTSMGCRVKYDVCLLCEHEARTPDHYCEHVHKHASYPFGMCEVLEDGRVCGVKNPDPVFFDISRLRSRPAFVGSENLMKVAREAREERARYELFSQTPQDKVADMVKELPVATEGAVVGRRIIGRFGAQAPKLPVEELVKSAGSLPAALVGSIALGVIWSPEEFREGVKVATGKDPGAVAWPTVKEISEHRLTTKNIVDWFALPVPDLSDKLASVTDDRSLLQPLSFNRCQQLKTASDQVNSQQLLSAGSDNGYRAYRALCLMGLERDCPIDSVKVADTMLRVVSKLSTDLARGLWTKDSCGDLEKQANVMNTDQTLFFTGSMLETMGQDVLDQLARNTLL